MKRLLLMILLSFCMATTGWTDDMETLYDHYFESIAAEQFTLDSEFGTVNVRSGKDDQVRVHVLGNEATEESLEFTFEESTREIVVRAEKKDNFSKFKNKKLSYEIEVPRRMQVTIKTGGGAIHVEDIDGDHRLDTSGGSITLANLSGKIEATTSGGDIQASQIEGPLELHTSGGWINAEACRGQLTAETSGGNINLDCGEGTISAETSGGNIFVSYAGKNQGIELETSAGNIGLELAEDIQADVTLSTNAGSIDVDFKLEGATKKGFINKEVSGEIHGGGPQIRCETSAGSITLSRKAL